MIVLGILMNLEVNFLKMKNVYVINKFVFINEKLIGFFVFCFFNNFVWLFVFINILLLLSFGFFLFKCFIYFVFIIVNIFLIIVVGISCDINVVDDLFKILL